MPFGVTNKPSPQPATKPLDRFGEPYARFLISDNRHSTAPLATLQSAGPPRLALPKPVCTPLMLKGPHGQLQERTR